MSKEQIREQIRVFFQKNKDKSYTPQQVEEVVGAGDYSGYIYNLLNVMAKDKLLKKVFPEKNKKVYFQYW